MIDGDLLGYVPTAGRADEPGGVQAKGVQKADDVRGEIGERVTTVWLGAVTNTTLVGHDHVPGPRQERHEALETAMGLAPSVQQ